LVRCAITYVSVALVENIDEVGEREKGGWLPGSCPACRSMWLPVAGEAS